MWITALSAIGMTRAAYNTAEADLPGIHVKVAPSQELSDALIRMSKEKGED